MLREAAATPDQIRDCSALRRTWERTLGCTTLPRLSKSLRPSFQRPCSTQ